MDLLHAHVRRSGIRGSMMPLFRFILAAQMIYCRGSMTSTILLRCGSRSKADWTRRQIRLVELRLFPGFTPYAHWKTRRSHSILLDWLIFARNWSDLPKPSQAKQWKLASSLPCQRNSKRPLRYSNNKSSSNGPASYGPTRRERWSNRACQGDWRRVNRICSLQSSLQRIWQSWWMREFWRQLSWRKRR